MRLFLDTNLFVAVLTGESEHATAAQRVLNSDHELFTSVLNLMELRTVLTKKKLFDRDGLAEAERRIVNKTTVTILDARDVLNADSSQQETLLYPMDALILAAADGADATLVSFDAELLDHGALAPEAVPL